MPSTPAPLPAFGPLQPADLARLAVLLEPEWQSGFTLRTSFSTGISTAKSGVEQRVALRGIPVREMSYIASGIVLDGLANAKAQALQDAKSRNFLPLLSDQAFLSSDVAAGATLLPVESTVYRRFQAGGYLAVYARRSGSAQPDVEQLEILSVTPTSITLASPTVKEYPAGATVTPLVVCELRTKASGSFETASVGDLEVEAQEVSAPSMLDIEGSEFFVTAEDTYGPYPIFPSVQDYGGGGEWSVLRDVESEQVGNSSTMLPRGTRGRSAFKLDFSHVNRESSRRLLRFFETSKGMAMPFFFISPFAEMQNVQLTESAGTFTGLTCDAIFPITDWEVRPFVGIIFADGTSAVRSATGYVEEDGVQTLAFDFPVPAKAICRVSKAYFGRFGEDAMEEGWITDGVVASSLSLEELEEVPSMPLLPLRLARCDDSTIKKTPSFDLMRYFVDKGLLSYGANPVSYGALIHEDEERWSVEQYSGVPGTDEISVFALDPAGCFLESLNTLEFDLSLEEIAYEEFDFEMSLEPITNLLRIANFTLSLEKI